MVVEMEYVSWKKVMRLIVKLAQKIKEKPTVILGILRGGAIVARLLDDLIDAKYIKFIRVELYRDINVRRERIAVSEIPEIPLGSKVLVCDDIVDTGATLAAVKEKFSHILDIKTAALHCKPHTSVFPDYYAESTNKWIVYPWEIGETLRKLGRKSGLERAAELLVQIGAPKETVEMVCEIEKKRMGS